MIFVGGAMLLLGIINVIVAIRNNSAKGLNITRLKFVTYNIVLTILGLIIFIIGTWDEW